MRARIGEVDDDEQTEDDAEPGECPDGRVQPVVIAALEIHQDQERRDGPGELTDDEVIRGDVIAKLGYGAGGAIEDDQAEADHGENGEKENPVGFQFGHSLRNSWTNRLNSRPRCSKFSN